MKCEICRAKYEGGEEPKDMVGYICSDCVATRCETPFPTVIERIKAWNRQMGFSTI